MAVSLLDPFAVKDIIEGGKAFADNLKESFAQAQTIAASLPPGTRREDVTVAPPLLGGPEATIQAPDGEPLVEFRPEATLPGIPTPAQPQTREELLKDPRTTLRRPTITEEKQVTRGAFGREVTEDVTITRKKEEAEMTPFEREVSNTMNQQNMDDFLLTFTPGPESLVVAGGVVKGKRGKKVIDSVTGLFNKIKGIGSNNKKLSPLVKEGGKIKDDIFESAEKELFEDLPPFLREEVKKQKNLAGKLEVLVEFTKNKKRDVTNLDRLNIVDEAAEIVSKKPTVQPKVTFNDLDQLVKDKVITKDEIYDMATMIAKDPTKVAVSAEFQAMTRAIFSEEATKFNIFFHAVGDNPNPTQSKQLKKLEDELWDLAAAEKLITGTSGRGLSLTRTVPSSVSSAAHKAVKKIIKDLPEEDARALHRAILEAGNDPEKVHEAIAKFTTSTFGDKFLEFTVNGMLSNVVKTGYRNVAGSFLSTVLNTARQPIEVGVEAARALKAGRPREVFGSEIIPGIAAGAKTTPQAMLDLVGDLFKIAKGQPVTGKIRTGDPIGRVGAIPGKLGEFIRSPGKLLTAFDKPFKEFVEAQAKERFKKRLDVGKQIRLDTMTPENRKLAEEAIFGKEGKTAATGLSTIDDRARTEALEVLFQADLGPTGKAIAKLLNTNPLVASQFPFIRTGINILKESTKHTPFGFFMAQGRDNPEFARQMAKPIMGSLIMTGALYVALGDSEDGRPIVTASAPRTNQGEREQFYATESPNSILIGGQYIPFKDLEPVALSLALVAKAAQQIKENPTPDSPGDLLGAGAELLNLGALEIAKNFGEKSFMKTLGEFTSAMTMGETAPEGKVSEFLASRATVAIPFQSAVGATARAIDPVLRQREGIAAQIIAQIPVLSKTLPAKRNIFGETIKRVGGAAAQLANIFPKFTPDTSPLREELRTLDVVIQPVSRVVDGVRLTAREYETLQIIAGKKFQESFEKILALPGYQDISNAQKEKVIKKAKSNADKEGRLLYQLNFEEGFKESILGSKQNQLKFWDKYLESTSIQAAQMTDNERKAWVKKNLDTLMEEQFDKIK